MTFKEVVPTNAASLVILRDTPDGLEVLMGRRRKTARFMPGYYVYPGGAVDPVDTVLSDITHGGTPYHIAALRETWEEAGVAIAEPGDVSGKAPVDDPYCGYLADNALLPAPSALRYVARAITPRRSPIRFDTRFFLTGTTLMNGTPQAIGELPEVMWISTKTALKHRLLSDVTRFVLREALTVWSLADHTDDPNRPVNRLTYQGNRHQIDAEPQSAGLSWPGLGVATG